MTPLVRDTLLLGAGSFWLAWLYVTARMQIARGFRSRARIILAIPLNCLAFVVSAYGVIRVVSALLIWATDDLVRWGLGVIPGFWFLLASRRALRDHQV